MKARLPQGMGGGPQNMNAMIKQAQKMQEDMAALQADLDAREYDISAGGGAVKIQINGKLEVQNIEIDEEIVDPDDVEMLEDLIAAAVNEVVSKLEADSSETMGAITGSMPSIPGLF